MSLTIPSVAGHYRKMRCLYQKEAISFCTFFPCLGIELAFEGFGPKAPSVISRPWRMRYCKRRDTAL
jgi:hypothetical protein